jgi:phosphinothricin acetyltransferase
MACSILPMLPRHWPAVREIYREGIATGNATFETELPDWEKWDIGHYQHCRLLAVDAMGEETTHEDDGERLMPFGTLKVSGFAALSPVSTRRVYAGVAEVSVYVAAARGRGIGRKLLSALVQESEVNGIWTLQAGIFPENSASIALHKSYGFRKVGVRRRIGKLGDTWRDVLLMERRSSTVGV